MIHNLQIALKAQKKLTKVLCSIGCLWTSAVAFHLPCLLGSKNILWSKFKHILDGPFDINKDPYKKPPPYPYLPTPTLPHPYPQHPHPWNGFG